MAFGKKEKKSKWENVWGTEFWTEDLRLQFVHLKEIDMSGPFPRKKFCVMALVAQDDESGLAVITDGICSVVSEHLGTEVELDDIEKHPLLDEKLEIRDGDTTEIEGAAGHYYFTPVANEENPPECLSLTEDGNPESAEYCDPDEIYAGCYGRLLLTPWMYAEGSVTFALRAVVKTAEGERFKTAAPQSAKSSFVAKWAQKAEAAPAGKFVKKTARVEEPAEQEEAPVRRGRGRPAVNKGLNGKGVVAAQEETEETDAPDDADDTPAQAPVKSKGLAGLNKGRPVHVTKVGVNPGYRKPPEEDEADAPAPVKKGLGKAKGLSGRL